MRETLYLVTGVSGHVGNTLAQLLLQEGAAVRGFALADDDGAKSNPGVEYFYGDICDRASLEPFFECPQDCELVVVHTAGIVSIASRYSQMVYDVNVNGTRNIVELCQAHKVKKLVYVSSVHAIPEGNMGDVIQEVRCFDPANVHGLYAKTKAEATQIVLDAASNGLDASVVHPSGIIGPYDYGKGHLTQLVLDYVDGRLGACVRGGYDFVDVRDVAACILQCVKYGKRGECYICSNQYLSVRELMDILHEVTGRKKVRVVLPMFLAKLTAPLAELYYKLLRQPPLFTAYSLYTLSSNANFSHEKADRELKIHQRPIRQTLEDTYQWLRDNRRFQAQKRPMRKIKQARADSL